MLQFNEFFQKRWKKKIVRASKKLSNCSSFNFLLMRKSDFHMGHAKIWFLFISATTISQLFWKCMEIYQWPSLILNFLCQKLSESFSFFFKKNINLGACFLLLTNIFWKLQFFKALDFLKSCPFLRLLNLEHYLWKSAIPVRV